MINCESSLFHELTYDEMQVIDGGGPWEAAVAAVVWFGAVAKTSFDAGRQFVRDIRNKSEE